MLRTDIVSVEFLRKSLTTYHLYLLRDPRTTEVRYVGCCEKPAARLNGHVNGNYRSRHVAKWVDSLIAIGLRPDMDIVETCVGKANALRREKQLIAEWFAVCGQRLLNTFGVPDFFPVHRLENSAIELRRKIDRWDSLGLRY